MFIPLLIIFGTFVTDTVARKNGRPNRESLFSAGRRMASFRRAPRRQPAQ
jgi:hypothetical protein